MAEEQEIGFMTDGAAMPFSSEAEKSVLGAIFLEADCLVEVMEILPSGDYFYLAMHRCGHRHGEAEKQNGRFGR